MEQVRALVHIIPVLHELNKGKGKNSDTFLVLNTTLTNSEQWWDSLNAGKRVKVCGRLSWIKKIDVGEIALHFRKMSARYKWDCSSKKYKDVTKSQRKIIDFVFAQRDKKFSVFDLKGLFKL